MNPSVLVPVIAAVVGVVFAALSSAIGRAPGWGEYRWYALIAASAAIYMSCDCIPPLSRDPIVVAWASRTSLLAAGVHGYAWIRYIAAGAGRPNTPFERGVGYTSAAVGVLSLVPGLVVRNRFTVHTVSWLGASYADASTSTVGPLVFALVLLGLVVPFTHFARQWRSPVARAHAIGLACLIVAGANDSAVAASAYSGPYLIDVGYLVIVVAAGGAMGTRFLASALALERLSTRLEQEVAERSQRLAQALGEAQRNEKLAAMGRLAAGVAHEINNPAAAVQANLQYLQEQLEEGQRLPDDATACIEESLMSVERIKNIVRQLLDTARVAGHREEPAGKVEVAAIVANALAASRTTRDEDVSIQVRVPPELCLQGSPMLVEQVLVNLLANAGQALAETSRQGVIEVQSEERGGRVAIRVRDNANGIPDSARAHLFEPFYTTKPQNKGTGLGLAVSLGLVRALGGDLRVEATSVTGTTMVVELPACDRRAA